MSDDLPARVAALKAELRPHVDMLLLALIEDWERLRALLAEAGEALLAALAAERRKTAKSFGACMSCYDGAPEPIGCTDCLNTGYEGGAPQGFVREDFHNEALAAYEAQRDLLAEAGEALRPFATIGGVHWVDIEQGNGFNYWMNGAWILTARAILAKLEAVK
jgi:hypothetical protein